MGESCLSLRVCRVARALNQLYSERLVSHGLTPQQLTLLAVLTRLGRAAPAQLGRALGMEQSTVSRNLARLESLGLAAYRRSDTGRLLEVRIEAAGHEALAAAHADWRRAQREAEQLLGPALSAALREAAGPAETGGPPSNP